MPSRPSLRTIGSPPSRRPIAGDVIGRSDDVVIVATARAEAILLELVRALGPRAAGLDFAVARANLHAEPEADGLLEDELPAPGIDDAPLLDRLPGLLLVSEVAAYLRKSPRSVTRMIARGELPCTRFGGTPYIPEAALVARLDTQIIDRLGSKRRCATLPPAQSGNSQRE